MHSQVISVKEDGFPQFGVGIRSNGLLVFVCDSSDFITFESSGCERAEKQIEGLLLYCRIIRRVMDVQIRS